MDVNKNKQTYLDLAKKCAAVITASLAALLPAGSKAAGANNTKSLNSLPDHENIVIRKLQPMLVLKLNTKHPESSKAVMHSSHASHASHASYSPPPGHYSHSSHSSHLSSSPTYSPSSLSPLTTTPASNADYGTDLHNSEYNSSSNKLKIDTTLSLGARVLKKGSEGRDVRELQHLLSTLGYNDLVNGYFDEKTEESVMSFQRSKGLKPDGQVGKNTLASMRKAENK